MGKNIKRLVIKVSVAYDTDLDKAKEILNKILEQEDRILQYPVPVVAASAFNAGAIDFDLFFWLNHRTASAGILRSDIISRINSSFKEAGIIIPIPQQDLYIRSVPNEEELKNEEKPFLPPS
jgi:small-conductance mechanosensitive channel